MKISMKIVVIVLVTIAVSVAVTFITLGYLGKSVLKDVSEQRLKIARENLEDREARLGVRCSEADKTIRYYVDAVSPMIGKLKKGEGLAASDPIFHLGEKTSGVIASCGIAKIELEANNDYRLSHLVFDREEVRREIATVRLLLIRAAASSCDKECVQSSGERIEVVVSQLRDQLRSSEKKEPEFPQKANEGKQMGSD